MLDESSADEQPSPRTTPKATTSFSSKQHKHIDYTRALDATQLYLNEIGFSPLLTPEEEVHFVGAEGRSRWSEADDRATCGWW